MTRQAQRALKPHKLELIRRVRSFLNKPTLGRLSLIQHQLKRVLQLQETIDAQSTNEETEQGSSQKENHQRDTDTWEEGSLEDIIQGGFTEGLQQRGTNTKEGEDTSDQCGGCG